MASKKHRPLSLAEQRLLVELTRRDLSAGGPASSAIQGALAAITKKQDDSKRGPRKPPRSQDSQEEVPGDLANDPEMRAALDALQRDLDERDRARAAVPEEVPGDLETDPLAAEMHLENAAVADAREANRRQRQQVFENQEHQLGDIPEAFRQQDEAALREAQAQAARAERVDLTRGAPAPAPAPPPAPMYGNKSKQGPKQDGFVGPPSETYAGLPGNESLPDGTYGQGTPQESVYQAPPPMTPGVVMSEPNESTYTPPPPVNPEVAHGALTAEAATPRGASLQARQGGFANVTPYEQAVADVGGVRELFGPNGPIGSYNINAVPYEAPSAGGARASVPTAEAAVLQRGPIPPERWDEYLHRNDVAYQIAQEAAQSMGLDGQEMAEALTAVLPQVEGLHGRYRDEVETYIVDSTREMAGLRQAINQLDRAQVDPTRFYSSAEGFTGIAAAINVGLGAMVSVLAPGTPNFALNIIDHAIERDIHAQEVNIANQQQQVQNRFSFLQHQERVWGNRRDALLAMRAMYYQDAARRVQALAAQHGGRQAMYNGLLAAEELRARGLQAEMELWQNRIETRVSMAGPVSMVADFVNQIAGGGMSGPQAVQQPQEAQNAAPAEPAVGPAPSYEQSLVQEHPNGPPPSVSLPPAPRRRARIGNASAGASAPVQGSARAAASGAGAPSAAGSQLNAPSTQQGHDVRLTMVSPNEFAVEGLNEAGVPLQPNPVFIHATLGPDWFPARDPSSGRWSVVRVTGNTSSTRNVTRVDQETEQTIRAQRVQAQTPYQTLRSGEGIRPSPVGADLQRQEPAEFRKRKDDFVRGLANRRRLNTLRTNLQNTSLWNMVGTERAQTEMISMLMRAHISVRTGQGGQTTPEREAMMDVLPDPGQFTQSREYALAAISALEDFFESEWIDPNADLFELDETNDAAALGNESRNDVPQEPVSE